MNKKNAVMTTLLLLIVLVMTPAFMGGEALEVQAIGSLDIQGGAQQVRVWGNYAYIIGGANAVRVIDISNPSSPYETDSLKIPPDGPRHLEISGRHAYVANGSGFRVIDIENPTDIKDVAGYEETLSGYSLEVKDNTVFLQGNANREISIIDVSNPLAPEKIGSYKPQVLSFIFKIQVSGNYAFLSGVFQNFEIVDISTPSAPVFTNNFNTGGNISNPDVTYHVSGKYMYWTSCITVHCVSYFKVYDISDPKAVQALGHYQFTESSGVASGIFAASPFVFCAHGSNGVRVIDVTNPASPSELGVFNESGDAEDVFVSGGYIYVADAGSGLKIFKIASSPTVKITNLESGQYVSGKVAVQAEAAGSDIAKVEFYADHQKLDECSSGICSFDWNTGAYPDGNHKLSVIAYDTANRTATYEIYVVKDSSLPALALNRTQFYFGAVEQGNTPGAQNLFIENSGGGTLNWTAVGPGWLQVSPSTGAGNALISLTVNTTNLSVGTYTDVVTISDPQAVNSPISANVTLTIYPAASGSAAPFGVFETPRDGDTVCSSIPVTGWCLDDTGIESVKIYRDPVSGEENNPVYIGDAIFIEGARPDVESAYPHYPFNYKAGWGYLMLTNSLPNSGNGTFTFHAVALDNEGHRVTLGTKTITCDNALAVKPFGAIDTPIQGGAAAGKNFVNFAWALTPLPNKIPVDGSTITVWVDGRPLKHPVYNIYREDIATLFPEYNNSNGALGYYYLDARQFRNGVHTISWSVTDDAGNSDAIGSRYFTIQNPGTGDQVLGGRGAPPCAPVFDSYSPTFDKIKTVEIHELERVEINLSAEEVLEGYSVVGDQLRELPIGSTLDREKGIFYWQPGPGFVGDYTLVFTTMGRGTERIAQKITVRILAKFGN
ncbi:MAG: Ig-like domain-containing protein [Candidatus Aminicenantes bacterium]|nr:Ig-like domain-containing protein [Candidatus Aminicenantes bacterium]